MRVLRMIDANINRVSEGLRVLEDIARFYMNNHECSKVLRELRHTVRKTFDVSNLMLSRDTQNDVGIKTTRETNLDNKSSMEQLIKANFKRVQEGLRVIEDSLKITKHCEHSKTYENVRYKTYQIEKQMFGKAYPKERQIYLILGESFSNGRTNLIVLKEALEAGIKIIQYREKNKSRNEKLEECKELIELVHLYNGLFIVNDDIDIAISIGADGIHLGQDDFPIASARLIAPNMFIGVSTHNIEQAKKAEKAGADYIGVGPMFETITKLNIELSGGIGFLEKVSKEISIPHVAIGGIKENNIISLMKSGMNQCAMISEIVGSDNIQEKIKSIINEMEKSDELYDSNGCGQKKYYY